VRTMRVFEKHAFCLTSAGIGSVIRGPIPPSTLSDSNFGADRHSRAGGNPVVAALVSRLRGNDKPLFFAIGTSGLDAIRIHRYGICAVRQRSGFRQKSLAAPSVCLRMNQRGSGNFWRSPLLSQGPRLFHGSPRWWTFAFVSHPLACLFQRIDERCAGALCSIACGCKLPITQGGETLMNKRRFKK
jgi:hypothetical protein